MPDVIEVLLDDLEQALDPETRAALERHFQDCASCLAYLPTTGADDSSVT